MILAGTLIKKANKHVYFLILLHRADIPPKDIVMHHASLKDIVFHHVLPKYLQENIERVNKKALHIIISPESTYI